MFIEPRQGIEICKKLRELFSIDPTRLMSSGWPELGETIVDCPLDCISQRFTCALRELANLGNRLWPQAPEAVGSYR